MSARENEDNKTRVLVLGGSGRYGSGSARRLAALDLISEVGVAGRNRDRLDRVVAMIGSKARAVQFDILDDRRLASVVADYDIVVNMAGPEYEVLLPALRAAIDAGKHYCDVGADGPTVEKQLELDATAKEQGIVAMVGMGGTAIVSLLSVHAYRQFDRTEEIQICHYVNRYLPEQVDSLRESGRIDTSLQVIVNAMSKPARVYRDEGWMDIDALENRVNITLPEGGTATAYPLSFSLTVTLSRYLPGVRSVSCVWGVPNPQLGELMFSVARRISCGEMSARAATISFLETIEQDPDRWLKTPPGPLAVPRWIGWVVATGWKDGRRGRYTCWPIRFGRPLVVAVLRILRGEVSERGVLPPESCFEPLPFIDEAVSLLPDPPPDRKLLGESFEWLE